MLPFVIFLDSGKSFSLLFEIEISTSSSTIAHGSFPFQVKGREKFEMLLKIKESLDLMDMVPQAQLDAYRRRFDLDS